MTQPGLPICVLGMHRSGTSVLTRILNVLGVHLGPDEQLLGPSDSNPKGHWEHQEFIKINDEILNRFEGNWNRVPEFPEGWGNDRRLDDLEQLARKMLREDFSGVDLWGWKDPRTCLTLAFWQRLIGPMKYVLSFRNPIDVANSLNRRDGSSIEQGVSLWLAYVQRALAQTENESRLLVFYEDLLDNWQHEIDRITAFLEKPTASAEMRNAVEGAIHKELRHHHTPIDCNEIALTSHDSTDGIAKAQSLYAQLKCGISL